MIVLKEFPASYRAAMACLGDAGFTRIPSMPMTKLALPFKRFDEYMRTKLSSGTRMKLRRKLRACASAQPPVTLEVTQDASGMVDDIYPLYLNVFARSPLQFEKLTKEFLAEIGARMPDKTRFLVWRQEGRAVAFALCMMQGEDICSIRSIFTCATSRGRSMPRSVACCRCSSRRAPTPSCRTLRTIASCGGDQRSAITII